MTPNPFSGLLHSRKFLLLVLDSIVSTITMILTHILAPTLLIYALGFVTIWQAVFIALINAIATEDVAKTSAGIQQDAPYVVPPVK